MTTFVVTIPHTVRDGIYFSYPPESALGHSIFCSIGYSGSDAVPVLGLPLERADGYYVLSLGT